MSTGSTFAFPTMKLCGHRPDGVVEHPKLSRRSRLRPAGSHRPTAERQQLQSSTRATTTRRRTMRPVDDAFAKSRGVAPRTRLPLQRQVYMRDRRGPRNTPCALRYDDDNKRLSAIERMSFNSVFAIHSVVYERASRCVRPTNELSGSSARPRAKPLLPRCVSIRRDSRSATSARQPPRANLRARADERAEDATACGAETVSSLARAPRMQLVMTGVQRARCCVSQQPVW